MAPAGAGEGAASGTNLPACSGGGWGSHDELSRGLIILFALLAAVVLAGSVGIAWLLFRRRKESQEVTDWKMTAFTQLGFSESDVLGNIREENVIGSGGSGKVYRIHLTGNGNEERGIGIGIGIGGGDGRMVAVKRIWNSRKVDEKLDKEFESEVKVLGNIRHNNIVRLLCCISSQEAKLLVYEYMENGSLDRWLHHRDREGAPAPLDWPTRLAIAVDAAKGLSYMHHDCAPPIVHRDVKSSNILLDPDFQAKIADFGLARILVKSGEPQSVSAIGGTFGYMAPDYFRYGKVSEKVDVFSFGVVLLELITGKKPHNAGTEPGVGLAKWASEQYRNKVGWAHIIDKGIQNPALLEDMKAVFRLGIACTSEDPRNRPAMNKVLEQLQSCDPSRVKHRGSYVSKVYRKIRDKFFIQG